MIQFSKSPDVAVSEGRSMYRMISGLANFDLRVNNPQDYWEWCMVHLTHD